MKELVAGARWNLRPCARSPRLRMSFRLRKRARNQRTWTVPPTGAFPTRTRGFHGVNCRANARFGSVVEGAELQFCSPERNWTPAKADGTGGCIAPSTPRSRTESRHCGGFGHYSTLLVLLLGLSRTATVGSVTLTASYPASFFPAGEVPRQHPGLLSRRRRRLLVLRPRPKRRCQKYQRYPPW